MKPEAQFIQKVEAMLKEPCFNGWKRYILKVNDEKIYGVNIYRENKDGECYTPISLLLSGRFLVDCEEGDIGEIELTPEQLNLIVKIFS